MSTPKAELRAVVLDILLGKEPVAFDTWQFGHLTANVAEVLWRRHNSGDTHSGSMFQPERRLEEEDWELVQEIFWDLVCERILTPGKDHANPLFPWFRLHSEAAAKLK